MGTIYWAAVPETEWDGLPYAGIESDLINGTVPFTGTVHGSGASPTVTDDFEDIAESLSEGTGYYIAASWSDGVDDSDVVISDEISTATTIDAVGVLQSGNAFLSGDFYREVKASGSIVSGDSSISGSLARVVTLTGILESGPSQVSGSLGFSGNSSVSGNIQSGDSEVSGALTRTVKLSGDLQSGESSISGSAKRKVSCSGELISHPANISGVLTVNGEEPELGRPHQSIKISTGRQA